MSILFKHRGGAWPNKCNNSLSTGIAHILICPNIYFLGNLFIDTFDVQYKKFRAQYNVFTITYLLCFIYIILMQFFT